MSTFPLPQGYQRLNPFPIDESSVFTSYALLNAYIQPPTVAYPGQVCAVNDGSTVKVYKVNPDYTVSELAAGSSTQEGVVSITAGQALSGQRAVLASGVYADNSSIATALAIGITTGAVSNGASATVKVSGSIIEPTWSWTLGLPVYLGTGGLLTQTVPTTGVVLEIGKPVTSTQLFINIQQPVILG
jgi:hypothetical protein